MRLGRNIGRALLEYYKFMGYIPEAITGQVIINNNTKLKRKDLLNMKLAHSKAKDTDDNNDDTDDTSSDDDDNDEAEQPFEMNMNLSKNLSQDEVDFPVLSDDVPKSIMDINFQLSSEDVSATPGSSFLTSEFDKYLSLPKYQPPDMCYSERFHSSQFDYSKMAVILSPAQNRAKHMRRAAERRGFSPRPLLTMNRDTSETDSGGEDGDIVDMNYFTSGVVQNQPRTRTIGQQYYMCFSDHERDHDEDFEDEYIRGNGVRMQRRNKKW